MMAQESTIERARGRWREILPRLGVSPTFLTNRHGPCPLCGGKDRFRFDDKDGTGTYYCNQCGAGSGMTMVQKKHNWSFGQACAEIDTIIGINAVSAPRSSQADDRDRRRRDIERTIRDARSPGVVDRYLRSRGIALGSTVLLGHPGLWHTESNRKPPAVVAPIVDLAGTIQSVQRVFIGATEARKKTLPPLDTVNGAAVRLHEAGEDLGIAEGFETALAASTLFGVPTWAAITANGIRKFEPPATVKRLLIFGDNDENYDGQAAAFALAHRLGRKHLAIEVHIPPGPGTDWLDVLNDKGLAT